MYFESVNYPEKKNQKRTFNSYVLIDFNCALQVKSVKIKPTANTNNGCGIDGELLRVSGQAFCSLLPEQCRLLGRPAKARK